MVYLENQQTIFVGNFVANNSLPKMKEHYSLQEWMNSLERIENLSWEYLVSSHGVKGSKNALESTQTYLKELKQNIITSIKKQDPKIKTLEDVKLSSYSHLAFYDDFHTDNIEQAYNECKELTPIETISKEEQLLIASMADIETETIIPQNLEKNMPIEVKKEIITTKKSSVKKIKVVEKEVIKKPHELIAQTMLNASIFSQPSSVPNIKYTNFAQAKQDALREHKYILIKIETNNCKPCDRLNDTLSKNNHIKKMINQHIKAVKINTDFDSIPLGLSSRGTPTVFLIEPENDKVVMKLEPEEVGELEESLKVFINDDQIAGLKQSLNNLINN